MAQNNLANNTYAVPGYYSAGEQQTYQNQENGINVKLQKIAKQAGLSLSNKNVRNVSK